MKEKKGGRFAFQDTNCHPPPEIIMNTLFINSTPTFTYRLCTYPYMIINFTEVITLTHTLSVPRGQWCGVVWYRTAICLHRPGHTLHFNTS